MRKFLTVLPLFCFWVGCAGSVAFGERRFASSASQLQISYSKHSLSIIGMSRYIEHDRKFTTGGEIGHQDDSTILEAGKFLSKLALFE